MPASLYTYCIMLIKDTDCYSNLPIVLHEKHGSAKSFFGGGGGDFKEKTGKSNIASE